MAIPTEQRPPAFHLHAEFRDFDALAEAIEGWDLDWQQLDRGRLEANLQQIRTPSALLSRVAFSRQFYQRGGTPPGFLTVGLLRQGTGEITWCGQKASGSSLIIFPSGGEYESMSQPGFGADTLSFSEDMLDGIARSLDIPGVKGVLCGPGQLLACSPGILAELRERLRTVFRGAAAESSVLSTPEFRREVEAEIPTLLLKALGSGGEAGRRSSPPVSSRVTRRAVAVIAETSDEPLTVRRVCEEIGVSQRTLQYAFRDQLDVTPKQYLQAVRLNGVRRDLQRECADVKIADVANRWGFWHLGQFAGDYRRQFGELPSETLARA